MVSSFHPFRPCSLAFDRGFHWRLRFSRSLSPAERPPMVYCWTETTAHLRLHCSGLALASLIVGRLHWIVSITDCRLFAPPNVEATGIALRAALSVPGVSSCVTPLSQKRPNRLPLQPVICLDEILAFCQERPAFPLNTNQASAIHAGRQKKYAATTASANSLCTRHPTARPALRHPNTCVWLGCACSIDWRWSEL